MGSLKKKCACPSCSIPVLVKGLHKNLPLSTMVACAGKLKDLLEARSLEERSRMLLDDQFHLTNSPLELVPVGLDALKSVANFSETDNEAESGEESEIEADRESERISGQENKSISGRASKSVSQRGIKNISGRKSKSITRRENESTPDRENKSISERENKSVSGRGNKSVSERETGAPAYRCSTRPTPNSLPEESEAEDCSLTVCSGAFVIAVSPGRKEAPASEPKPKRAARSSMMPKPTPKSTANGPVKLKTPGTAPAERNRSPTLKVLMSGFSPNDKALLIGTYKSLEGRLKMAISDTYDPRTIDRIIMPVDEAGLCTRTTKYLRGILDGVVIVTSAWFTESAAQFKWLPVGPYLVKGDTAVGRKTEAVKRALAAGDTKLFSDYTFYLVGKFGAPSKPDLATLLKSGGAKISSHKPKSGDLPDRHLAIYDPNCLDGTSVWADFTSAKASGLWVLDCISSYAILPLY